VERTWRERRGGLKGGMELKGDKERDVRGKVKRVGGKWESESMEER
jgi:hypothetical protein